METLRLLPLAEHLVPQPLEGHLALQHSVPGSMHHPHAAVPQFFLQLVVRECLPRRGWGQRGRGIKRGPDIRHRFVTDTLAFVDARLSPETALEPLAPLRK